MHDRSPHLRLRQAAILLGGGLAHLLLVAGPLGREWTPLVLGLVFALAAAAGGRDGGFWSLATVVSGWGLGLLAAREWGLDVPEAGAVLAGAGAGLVALEALRRRGVAVDPLGPPLTVLAAGLVLMLEPHAAVIGEPGTWSIAIGLAGAVQALLALRPGSHAGTPAHLD
jgi:hypothetical protein